MSIRYHLSKVLSPVSIKIILYIVRLILKINGFREKQFVYNNSSINYWIGGKGPDLLLIHGFAGDSTLNWFKIMPKLKRKNRIIVPDLLWFGKSYSNNTPSIIEQGKAMFNLMDYLNIDEFKVAGHSYGGFVVFELLYSNKSRIKDYTILSSPGVSYELSELNELCIRAGIDDVSELFVFNDHKGVENLLKIGSLNKIKLSRTALESIQKVLFSKNQKELVQLLNQLKTSKARYESLYLDKLPPSTLVWGENDLVFPLHTGQKLSSALNSKIVVLSSGSHSITIENHKEVIKELI
jgi:pimeloyl-ACP methyl ester carboxylesterase